jgi:tetraacyldisaccharide-1-P 4'-kinase
MKSALKSIAQESDRSGGSFSIGAASRHRSRGSAFVQLALTVTLILSIVVVITVAGASVAMARPDIVVMDDGARFSIAALLTLILLVMAVLTIMALRDVTPNGTKRAQLTRTRKR